LASKSRLRTGYTTGACAAAAAKAAAILVMHNAAARDKQIAHQSIITTVEIPFPDGNRHIFRIQNSGYMTPEKTAHASIIKDAGDDPDITNRAEIRADVRLITSPQKTPPGKTENDPLTVVIKGGEGVGLVTKPGLSTPVGEPAISPVPRKMIRQAVLEAIETSSGFTAGIKQDSASSIDRILEVTISVPEGKQLAKKTLNARLGIIDGISILGTTGIVRPVSSEAWTATITASMDVAKAMGIDAVVLSAGRSSETSHMKQYGFPEESYIMMGDYLEFSLLEAKRHGFRKIHLSAQWAKTLKIAMATPQTHVRHGALDIKKAVLFLEELWQLPFGEGHEFNTAMEIFQRVNASLIPQHPALFIKVCQAAKAYAERITEGISVSSYLVSYEGKVIAESE
jgi:cobalt-precorrin-5B (C1)-methyltransferase